MKNSIRHILIVLTVMAFIQRANGQERKLELWYKKPAVKWTEALPLGNGRIGAMIFGGVKEERIQFNEETLWTGGPREYARPGAWRYLDSIRQLIFTGKQAEAEKMAEMHFMGLKSQEGKKDEWAKKMTGAKSADADFSAQGFDDSNWKKMIQPSYDGWEVKGFEGLDGAVWLRKSFELPMAWSGKDLILDLNRIRDHDFTYVNGKLVGSTPGQEPRKYLLSASTLKPGSNTIAILVLNYTDKGGIMGYKDTLRHIGIYRSGADENERISLNGSWKYFVINDSPPATPKYQADYQPFGDINIIFPHETVSGYRRSLDLRKALAHVHYSASGINYHRTYLVSQPTGLFAGKITSDKKGSVSFDISLSSPHKQHVLRNPDNNSIELTVAVTHGDLKGAAWLTVRVSNGVVRRVGSRLSVTNADQAEIFLSVNTNFKSYRDLSADPSARSRTDMQNSKGRSFEDLIAAHIKEYQSYFNTLDFELGNASESALPTDERIKAFNSSEDPSFAALYLQYGRYLLIASSRPGTGPANLQGIWNDLLTPPWGSKYTVNINTEMNYWPAELLNLSPTHEPLFRMIKELSVSGRKTAADHYNARGWVVHQNTDLWRGTAPINAANHGIWVTGGAWLCQHLWEHFLFTRDTSWLRGFAYPIMKEAALFFNDFLIRDPKSGWLISSPSNSPEQGGLVAGPTMDHQIIRALFDNVIQSASILSIDKILADTLVGKRNQIAPNKIGRYGQLQEWMEDKDDSSNHHRHVSHLWGQYPGNEINWDHTPDLMKAARQSLLFRGDAATGWSLGWKINFWARFKDGDHAFHMMKMLLGPANGGAGSYPNLFDAHPPFQIDGNFGGAAGIGEMLLQSHTEFIDILPALPKAWPSGSIRGIKARGGFTINMEWSEGRLRKLVLRSLAGMPCTLRYNGKVVSLKTEKNKDYSFDSQLNGTR